MAEQQLIGIAAGISLKNKFPHIFVQSTFLQRSYDQIIHDIAFMKIKCNIFSVRSGFSGLDSPTHHAIFDLTILPSIPNVNVRFPSTLKRAKIITKKLLFKKEKTCDIVLLPYFPVVDSVEKFIDKNYIFDNYGAFNKNNNSDVLLVSTSNSNNYILDYINKSKLNLNHLILEDISLSYKTINFLNKFKSIFILEENNDKSGLAAQISIKLNTNIKVGGIGVTKFVNAGSQNHTLKDSNLDYNSFINSIKNFIKK